MVKLTNDEFINKAKLIHGDKYDYSETEYTLSKNKVKIICPEHGGFFQQARLHLNNQGCFKCYIKKRTKSNNEFILSAKKIHGDKYDYSKVDYVNINRKVQIICKTHGIFEQLAVSHLKGRGCRMCVGLDKKDTQYFINHAKIIHGDKYDYSRVNYVNMYSKVEIICDTHGIFEQIANSHLKGYGCHQCSGLNKKDTEFFINSAKKIHRKQDGTPKYNYDKVEYTLSKNKVIITCPIHGDWTIKANNHLRKMGGGGCPDCKAEEASDRETFELDEFIKRAKKTHGEKYDYSLVNYTHSREKVSIICSKHGVFNQEAFSHYSLGQGCPRCFESKGEGLIEKILFDLDIVFVRQKKFEDCTNNLIGKSRKKLPFDFYLTNQNICIEYDGEQHFKPIEKFGGDKGFNRVKKTDELKNKYCKENGIKLIRIPYTINKKDFELYILEELGIK